METHLNFHPLIREWFTSGGKTPTSAQAAAWPLIAQGKHVLISSPTGSGKTLAAFLWAIDQLVTGRWSAGGMRVLYISPLKALNNDVRENLLLPLADLRRLFDLAGTPMPDIRVQTRSGDTPQNERRVMMRRPPEILITTPESLNILLTTGKNREALSGIRTVILDEIHALAGNKRGTHLITAVERLVPLAGEFQRIALSATAKPLPVIADFIGGYRLDKSKGTYAKRDVAIVESGDEKKYSVSVKFPGGDAPDDGDWWPAIIDECLKVSSVHTSTLIFVNSRRLAEKVSHYLNERAGKTVSYPHHGSLSRELRHAVESRLKKGELECIVATNSLELGIDVGSLESVVLIQSPFSVSGALQRIGRSGHGVGEASRGMIIPLHGRDFTDAAVVARAVMDRDIEPVTPVRAPLDVLSQLIVAMTIDGPVPVDGLFDMIRCSYPYRELSRKHFDLVLDMVAGRYAGTRVRELRGLAVLDAMDGTVESKKGARYLLYSSGGTIPERGYFSLRLQGSMAKIGELDEEFVWERAMGDTFSLGSGIWRIQEITHSDVIVTPSEAKPGIIPFWKNEAQDRDFHLSEKIALFLEHASASLDDPAFSDELHRDHGMEAPAADELISFLRLQRETAGSIPHRHNLLMEHFRDPAGLPGSDTQVILHTLWGGRVNRPVAMALGAAWKKRYGHRLEIYVGNDAIMLILPQGFNAGDIFELIEPGSLLPSLREILEETAYFGARFRETAGRALLLPRASLSRRYPLWLNRLRAKKLMDAASRLPDFPILLETWRTCLQDEFDLENAERMMRELQDGTIGVTETTTSYPSPFAGGIVYRQIEKYMYEDDRPSGSGPTKLSGDLIREVAMNEAIRPKIDDPTRIYLDEKLKRTATGYSPSSPADLLDWIRGRLLVPVQEWEALLRAMERDHGPECRDLSQIENKIAMIRLPGAEISSICSREMLPSLLGSLTIDEHDVELSPVGTTAWTGESPPAEPVFSDPEQLVAQWLTFYGPVEVSFIRKAFGFTAERTEMLVRSLQEGESIVTGMLTESSTSPELCDRENMERLIRLSRRSRRPAMEPLPAGSLQLFLAGLQRVFHRSGGRHALEDSLERLFGYPCHAALWEEAIFPARMKAYQTALLDSLMQTTGLIWLGCGRRRMTFVIQDDLELFDPADDADGGDSDAGMLASIERKTGFFDIVSKTGMSTDSVSDALWSLAWKGLARNDTYAVVRKGIESRFSPPAPAAASPGRRGYSRWRSSRPLPGAWERIDYGLEPADEMEREERNKDRVRILVKRYGVLFRELLERESIPFRWGGIFRTMRIMELSGELSAGHFFSGIRGLQFVSSEALRLLQGGVSGDAVYWINACDPVSLCGLGIEGLPRELPQRIPSNWLVFLGADLAMVLRRDGGDLEITVPPDHPRLKEALDIFNDFLERDFNPRRSILVESINDMPASESGYAPVMIGCGFRKTYNGLEIVKRY